MCAWFAVNLNRSYTTLLSQALFLAWCENHLCYKEWKKTNKKPQAVCLKRSCGKYINICNYSGSCCYVSSQGWRLLFHGSHTPSPHSTPSQLFLPLLLTPMLFPILSCTLQWPHSNLHCWPHSLNTSWAKGTGIPSLQGRMVWVSRMLILPVWICPPWSHVTLRNWMLLRAHDIYLIWFKLTKGFKGIRAQEHRLMAEGVIAWDYCLRKRGLKKIIKGQKSLWNRREGWQGWAKEEENGVASQGTERFQIPCSSFHIISVNW